jgi:hypothetical protein
MRQRCSFVQQMPMLISEEDEDFTQPISCLFQGHIVPQGTQWFHEADKGFLKRIDLPGKPHQFLLRVSPLR